jgi:hypothetical protein
MNIYSSPENDEFIIGLREWCLNNPLTEEDMAGGKCIPPVYTPILYGKDNGFYGRKHTPEQIKAWSEMRLGEKNPNYGGKAWTEESLRKLRQPKKNKENYKGTPGKITCINKNGDAIQINKELYNQQKDSGLPVCDWEYVNTNSREAIFRKAKKQAILV